jgi:hypothetical protein
MSFPNWLRGSGITTITVTPQVFSGGVLVTPAGPDILQDFFTVVNEIRYEHDVELRNVTPSRSRQRNMVIMETGGSFVLEELLRAEAAGLGGKAFNSLAALFHVYDYFKVRFVRAGTGYTFYAVNGGYQEGVGSEKGTGRGTFAPAGIVEAGLTPANNPTYQSA